MNAQIFMELATIKLYDISNLVLLFICKLFPNSTYIFGEIANNPIFLSDLN